MIRTLVTARCALVAAAAALVLLAAPSAHAQIGSMLGNQLQSGSRSSIGGGGGGSNAFRKAAPPPGLPGARTSPDSAAPADKLATDMQPTDALFDAVNRGDIAAAREALGRGADVNAQNILGLTPVDLSVDLGHTNITFLLLSMRAAAPAPDARRAAARAAAPAPGAAAAGGVKVRRAPLGAVHAGGAARTAERSTPARPAAPQPASRSQRVADDGGIARPSVGFLGFGR